MRREPWDSNDIENYREFQRDIVSVRRGVSDKLCLIGAGLHWSHLRGLSQLVSLHVMAEVCGDPNVLSGLSSLRNLSLDYCDGLEDSTLDFLSSLKSLRTLSLCGSAFRGSLTPLTSLRWLEVLHLETLEGWHSEVCSLKPLRSMIRLRELEINRYDSLTSLAGLEGTRALKSLDVCATQVNDISALEGLTSLEELNLSSTQVTNLEPLRNLVNLRELNLSNTHVTNLEPLRGLVNLHTITLCETHVHDLTPLLGLPELEFVDVRCCKNLGREAKIDFEHKSDAELKG